MPIEFHFGNDLGLDEVIELYRSSTLGERRPIDDRAVMETMVQQANLVVTAWEGDLLVGIARSLTDFAYVAYLADLAVHLQYQKRGIGRKLIGMTREKLGPKANIVLLSAPAAAEFYEKIGFSFQPRAWMLKGGEPFEY